MTNTVGKSVFALSFFAGLAFGQPFIRPSTTYTISGIVGDTSTLCRTYVTLTLNGSITVTDGTDGTYSFAGLAAGSYTITAAKPGCTYTPPSITVVLTNANSPDNNFEGSPAPITFSPATLPSAILNTAYSQQLTANGGVAPYAYTVISGNLPAGLTLSMSGLISGTPTQVTSLPFTVKAEDSRNVTGQMAYTISVTPTATLTIGPATLPQATVGGTYSAQLTASGGTAPYTFTLVSGNLPTGLSMPASGLISGTPTQQTTASFTVQAKDANAVTAQMSYTLSVNPGAGLTLGPASLPQATLGAPYSAQLTASGGATPYTFTLVSGNLPTGLTLSAGGLISGTPTQQAVANFSVQAKDANSLTGQLAYTLSVVPGTTLTFAPATRSASSPEVFPRDSAFPPAD